MKKFTWRLQRLLDVRGKQENAMRAELVAVTEQAVSVRGRIMLRRAMLRQAAMQIGRTEPAERIAAQRLFLQHSQNVESEVRGLEQRLHELETLRREKIAAILELRKARKSLEKLREKALEEHLHEQTRAEQGELDDRTSIAYARRILSRT